MALRWFRSLLTVAVVAFSMLQGKTLFSSSFYTPASDDEGGHARIGPITLVRNTTTNVAVPRLQLFNSTDRFLSNTVVESNAKFVMVFVNEGLLNIFGLWLHYYRESQTISDRPKTLLIFAINQEAFDSLGQTLHEDYLPPNTKAILTLVEGPKMNEKGEISYKKRKPIWVLRIKLLVELLEKFPTNDIIVSDIDALWFQDPEVHLFDRHPNADVIASRTHLMGCDLSLHWQDGVDQNTQKRNVAVFGFIYLRNTQVTRQLFVDRILSSLERYEQDDQMAFSCVLTQQYSRTEQFQRGATTDPNNSNATNGVKSTSWPDGTMLLRYLPRKPNEEDASRPFTLALLPGKLVRRRCRSGYSTVVKDKTVVAHCFVSFEKTKFFRNFGFVPSDSNNTLLYPFDAISNGEENKKA